MKNSDPPGSDRVCVRMPEQRDRVSRVVVGNGIVLLAVLGLMLCLGGIAAAWMLRSHVDTVGDAVFGAADEAFGFVEGKLAGVKEGLERSRQSAGSLSRIAGRLKNAGTEVQQEWEPLLQNMDEVRQRLQSAQSWLDSAEALARSVSRVSETLAASDFAASRQESTAVAASREVRAFADSVADALDQLQAMRGRLVELQNSGVVAREAVLALIEHVTALEQLVDRLAGRIEGVGAKVAEARTTCAGQARRFRRWTLLATLAASVLPVWFGLSQIVVMAYGWRTAHPAFQAA